MLWWILEAGLLGNLLTDKSLIRSGKGTTRAGKDF